MAKDLRKKLTVESIFDQSTMIFIAAASVAGVACYALDGRAAFWDSLSGDVTLFLSLLPKFGAAMSVAGLVQYLLPRDKVARYVSEEAGFKGLAIATAVGALTPGGPMASFPIVRALYDAGTGRGALIAYLTSWSTMGMQRILSWEVPLLGVDYALIRFAASLPLPFIAGLLSRLLPREPKPLIDTSDGTFPDA